MRLILLTILMLLSLIVAMVTVYLMNWIFWFSGAVFVWTVLYIERHRKDLESELRNL